MNELLARAGSLFLAPEAPTACPVVAPRRARFAAVLTAPDDLPATAGGVAAALRRDAGARTAVVCRPGEPFVARPATPAATSLARHLAAREHPAVAAGRLCRVALPSSPAEAVRDVWRLTGAVDVPVVLALPGRADGYDALLSEADHLYLATAPEADDTLLALAVDSLGRLGPPVTCIAVPIGAVARRAAAVGVTTLRLSVREPAQAPAR